MTIGSFDLLSLIIRCFNYIDPGISHNISNLQLPYLTGHFSVLKAYLIIDLFNQLL